MERKLASIQKVSELLPIENADNIILAKVQGWQCVVKRGQFMTGDLGVYFEIDSLLPELPEFDFMARVNYRVRTIKLRGTLSQGLLMPLSILPDGKWREGQDVTEILKVKKYMSESEKIQERLEQERLERSKNKITKFLSRHSWFRRLFAKKKSGFPKFIKKTDEIRVQNLPELFAHERDAKTVFDVTEKLDGQSATYYLVKNKKRFLWFGEKYIFGVCSRNLALNRKDNSTWWRIADKMNVKKKMIRIFNDYDIKNTFVIQGEIIGAGIQGNKYKLKDIGFYVFNYYFDGDLISPRNIEVSDFVQVPFLKEIILPETMDELLTMADGKSVMSDTLREGFILRNYEKGISFKAVSNKFLLEYE